MQWRAYVSATIQQMEVTQFHDSQTTALYANTIVMLL